jgi:hypothetical protein
MKELNHETSESFEGTWDANSRTDFDKDSFGGVDVDLQFAGFIDRRVEEGEETLQRVSFQDCCSVAAVKPDG